MIKRIIFHDPILYIAADLCGVLSMAGCSHFAKSGFQRMVDTGIIGPCRQYRDDLGFCVHPLAYTASRYKTGFMSCALTICITEITMQNALLLFWIKQKLKRSEFSGK